MSSTFSIAGAGLLGDPIGLASFVIVHMLRCIGVPLLGGMGRESGDIEGEMSMVGLVARPPILSMSVR